MSLSSEQKSICKSCGPNTVSSFSMLGGVKYPICKSCYIDESVRNIIEKNRVVFKEHEIPRANVVKNTKYDDILLTAVNINFLRICDKYKITLDDICNDLESCSRCGTHLDKK